ncbi:hypothetical protein PHYSODRAFT_337094 [Phytophthora sojae]|uniref:HTH CENPB-type domain-containing protein n=1 Tax=Phytophthora sojae (strain P6497) TaxID=1094619 RepID=G4ZY16_PHYSP|nr:hypothetical protein PHYSODRAFT_337094 [Phytophthora sojae]EGZ12676.1 hypothetical protein PHYSODRAFT_337094 [Phytophthora sojae]|eukprot:XP_009533009.1 hypothetical protein PHYSODRAFT_337094 [Phytophthora sojae]
MSSSSKTRTRLTQQQKLRLIKKAESSTAVKYEDLALWAKPHESAQRKNKPSPFQLQIDQNIVEFIMLAEAEGICLSASTIQKCWFTSRFANSEKPPDPSALFSPPSVMAMQEQAQQPRGRAGFSRPDPDVLPAVNEVDEGADETMAEATV